MKYKRITPSRWHHFVVWAIQTVIGQAVANDEADMNTERYIQRGKRMRWLVFRECAESRHEMRQKD